MSSGAVIQPGDVSPPAPPEVDKPRTLVRQVLGATFVRWGAKLGLAWIAVLVVLAVFAPFIASSHPVVMKMGGRWSSPMLRHLTPADVTLVVVFFTVLALCFLNRVRLRWRLLVLLGVLAVTIVITVVLVHPPVPVVYDQYRTGLAEGKVQWALFTLVPYSPSDRLRDRGELEPVAPWWAGGKYDHWLGTEPNGADIASKMIHASRIALAVGFIATGIAMFIGVIVGGFMGYFSGMVDLIGMRIVEIFEFIPQLFLLLMFVAFFKRNIYMIMGIIGLTSWAGYARFIRAEFLKLRQQDFVQAAIACGLPLRSILFRHMLPNGLAPVLVSASFGVASAILAEAVLSFLGLGLVDEPSWGQLLNQATRNAQFTWWIAIFPGLAIFLTVFAYNLIGEALRDAIDPHTSRTHHA
jgi:peptide/nickel transport system permease protein